MPFRCVATITRVDKTKPPPDMSFRASETESRNLPTWQILPCIGTFCHVVDSSTPLIATVGMTMGGRFYGFADCFCDVSRCPAASSVRATPCQLPRRGSSCTGLLGTGGCRGRFRPSTCGTAHRVFPTVSLIGVFFYTTYSKNGHVRRPDNCQLSTVNCQLSPIVNCPFPIF